MRTTLETKGERACSPAYLIHYWVVYNANSRNFPNSKTNRYTDKREAAGHVKIAVREEARTTEYLIKRTPHYTPMDEVSGSIEGIDNPGRMVRELGSTMRSRRLLPNELKDRFYFVLFFSYAQKKKDKGVGYWAEAVHVC